MELAICSPHLLFTRCTYAFCPSPFLNPGYAVVATVFAALILVAIISTIVLYLLRVRVNSSYKRLQLDEDQSATKENDKLQRTFSAAADSMDKMRNKPLLEKRFVETELSKEGYTESCYSDVDSKVDDKSLAAYGDASNRSSTASDILDDRPPVQIQLSLILNLERRYLAGKVTSIKEMPFPADGGPNQVKVHVVLLPARKYILKTKYIDIEGNAKADEYFKYKFKVTPDIELTTIRYRMYGRRFKFGILGRERCIGETFVALSDVAKARGGLTLWGRIAPKQLQAPPEEPR